MGATGTATINFGAAPGANEATVAVAGQTDILTTSLAEAFFMRETSADHTAEDHSYAALFCALTCDTPVAATGFNITARAIDKLTGQFTVRWVWAD